jgi:hypothetical protein
MDFAASPGVQEYLAGASVPWSADPGWSSKPTQFASPPRRGRSGGRELTALRTSPFAGLQRTHRVRDKI